MTANKGKRAEELISETTLNDRLSSDPKLDKATQSRIGDQLRAMYDGLLDQPVPDRFRDLLAKLDQRNEEKTQ